MPWESEEEQTKPRRDWARLMWYGIGVLMIVGIAFMFIPRTEYTESTSARVSHILLKADGQDRAAAKAAYDKIAALRQQILDGSSFASLAAAHSEDSMSASKGGDLGWVRKDELAAPIDSFIWTAPLNQVSDVIQTDYGFHLVIVLDRKVSKADLYELQLKERVLKGQGAAPEAPKP